MSTLETNAVHASSTRQRLLSHWLAVAALVAALVLPFFNSAIVFSQIPLDESAQVTATVPDTTGPSTPILIAPADASTTTDSTPTFIWVQSTDNIGVTGYVFYRDGVVSIDNIPTSATDTSTYTLTYDSITGRYSLTPKVSIGDGSHTWKIVAKDAVGNTTSSATWTVVIDTQGPTFVVTAIGSEMTSISAQDTSTIPITPIELSENEPIISGTGEANSTVILRVRLASDDSLVEEITFTIDSNGTWSVQLGTLERDTVMSLTFQITDQAGLLSVLEDVLITVTGFAIEIPLPDDFLPIDGPIVIPIDVLPLEIFSRTIHIVDVKFSTAFDTIFPEQSRATYISSSQSSRRLLSPVWYTHILVFVLLMTLPLLKFVLLAAPYGRSFSLNIGLMILSAILGYSDKVKASLIIEADSQKALPFMTIRLLSANQAGETSNPGENLILMSDEHGYFPNFPRINGSYVVRASIDGHVVEFATSHPPHLSLIDWYQGQVLNFQSAGATEALVLPVGESSELHSRFRLKRWLLSRPLSSIVKLCVAILILVITPTIGNFICTAVFGGLWLRKSWRSRMVNTHVLCGTVDKIPIGYCVIRINTATNNAGTLLLHANASGEASVWLKNGSYNCAAVHAGYRQKTPGELVIDQNTELHAVILLTPVIA